MATKKKNSVLPAQLVKDSNADLGGAVPATTAAVTGSAATAAALAKVPALAPLFTNPVTAAVAVAVLGGIIASPLIYNKAKQWSTNNKIRAHQNKLAKAYANPNDPKSQKVIAKSQGRLEQLTGRPGASFTPAAVANPNSVSNPSGTGQNDFVGTQPTGNFLSGTSSYREQLPRYTAEQQSLINRDIEELKNSPASFEPIAQSEIRRFKEDILPQISQSYFGNQAHPGLSGAYPEALGRGAERLTERLSAMKSEHQSQRERTLREGALKPSFENIYIPGQPGVGAQVGEGLGNAATNLAEQGLSWAGGKVGNYFSNKFFPEDKDTANPDASSFLSQFKKLSPEGKQYTYLAGKALLNNKLGGRTR